MIYLQLAKAGMFNNISTIQSLDVVPINIDFWYNNNLQYSSSEQFPILIIQLIKAYSNYEWFN